MKRLIAIAVLCVAPAILPAEAQEVTKLTFHDALERAEKVNNTVERARADVSVAEANKEQLLSNVLPRITLNGAAQRNSETVAFNAGGNDVTVLPRNDWNYHLNFSQPVYAGRREIRAYNQAKIAILNAREGVLGTEDAVLLRVASNYLGVVNADSRIAIEQKNIDVAQKRRSQASAFYEAGESTKVDVLRAETSIKAAQRQLAAAQQTREEAVSRLRADLDLNGPIEVTDTSNPAPAVPDEQALISRAETSRPDVAVALNNVEIARLEVQKQKGFWLPTVTFNGGYVSQKSAFPAPRYAFGAFNFTVPILQSGEVEARVAAARAREIQAQLDLDTAKTTAREDVRTALAALHEAETALGLAKEQLAAAEAEYNQVFETYRAQEATSLDVATSEASLADARRAVNEETLNRDLAQLRVWYVAGAMKEAVNVTSGAVQK
ncbi:MAG TPA: TolC family protein [Thermoanaerobaculia bacterium]|nr:TolC family protein [Thermoanaerobaculia bacterium]